MNDAERVAELLPELRSFISSKVPADEIDDLVNEVCLALALNANRWRGDSKFKSYAFAVAKKKVFDFFRRKYSDRDKMNRLQKQIKEEMKSGEDRAFDVWVNNDLTKSEFAVFKLVGLGRSNDEIAKELFISLDTVRSHIKSIYKKMGSSDRAKVITVAHDFLKIQDNHKEWLEKFYKTYIQLGEKGGHLTEEIRKSATQAKDSMMKRLSH